VADRLNYTTKESASAPMRQRTPLRSAVVTATVVLVLLAADYGARHYEEGRVARSIQTSLQLRSEPSVSLHGFPFISELARGEISTATIATSSITRGPARFSDVHVLLRNLRFSVRDLFDGHLAAIHAAAGIGTASMTTSSVNAFLGAHDVPFKMDFKGGHAIARLGPLTAPVDVAVTISNGSVHISAGSLPAVSLPLPAAFQGVTYGSLHAGTGRLILDLRLDHPTLDLRPTAL
jgi:hypothetical protein